MIRYLEPDDQWDQTLISDLLAKVNHDRITVTVVPGRYWYNKPQEINQITADDQASLIIITGDEEALFPIDKLDHPNQIIWQQTPHPNKPKIADRYFPIGYTPHTRSELKKYDGKLRPLRYFFSGQITHKRRKGCYEQLSQMFGGMSNATDGFTEGLPQPEYISYMVNSQTVPCPSGAVIQESFRVWETLEAGCVPLVDDLAPLEGSEGYWELLLGERPPFPLLKDWADLSGTTDYFCDTYPLGQNKMSAWWQLYKHNLARTLQKDIHKLNPQSTGLSTVSVLVPTSPIKDHPDTKHIDETIRSIRHHLPDAPIYIMIDGLREEQNAYKERYDQYINRLLWKTNLVWDNVTPVLFDTHMHQALMTRETLKLVDTPAILFVEHDTPLVTDYEIPFDLAIEAITDNRLDVIRFLHEADIHPEHKHLMVDTEPIDYGLPILRTGQWSQRPHLASTSYYRNMIETYFSDKANTMIEDRIHGITQQAWLERGIAGWNEHRIGIYAPEGNRKMSYTTDGRGQDPKFEMTP